MLDKNKVKQKTRVTKSIPTNTKTKINISKRILLLTDENRGIQEQEAYIPELHNKSFDKAMHDELLARIQINRDNCCYKSL